MTADRQLDLWSRRRKDKMDSAARLWRAGEITRQKLVWDLEKAATFKNEVWDETAQQADVLRHYRAVRVSLGWESEQRTEHHRVARVLGLPVDARTVHAVVIGELDIDSAGEAAEKIRRRHLGTDYDALLASGVGRETARDLMSYRGRSGGGQR